MNTRGFTLIELVSIIIILAAIFLVSFPNLLTNVRRNEKREYDAMIKNLCLSGESYIYSNMGDYSELSNPNSNIVLSIDELISNGYIDNAPINPKTNKATTDDHLKYTVLSDHSLECKYIEG